MSVAESLLRAPADQKYAHLENVYRTSQLALCPDQAQNWLTRELTLIKSGVLPNPVLNKQRYDLYQANLAQLKERKTKEAIAWQHPRDAVKEEAARTENELASLNDRLASALDYQKDLADGSYCPVNYDPEENGAGVRLSEKVSDFALVKESAIKIPQLEPLSLRSRLSFEPARQYYAPPNLVAPKVTSLQYDFMTECQWRKVKPYWTRLLKGLTEKVIIETRGLPQENKHFLAYALASTFLGVDFGLNEDTIELRLQDDKNFVCLKALDTLVKGDILIARGAKCTHSAIYFDQGRIMASLGTDKSRPRYMHLRDFLHHPELTTHTVYRFCA